MEKFPKDVLVLLAMEMNLSDILKFCQISKNVNRSVCKNNDFWRNKLYKDYPLAKRIESKEYEKIYYNINKANKIIMLTIETSESYQKNIGMLKLKKMRPELVDFLLNADFGNYEEIPLNFILFPILEKGIINISLLTSILYNYIIKYGFLEDRKKFFYSGPEMEKYLNIFLTKLENNSNKPFDRNKFTFNRLQNIVLSLVDKNYIIDPELSTLITKIQYLISEANKNRILQNAVE